MASNDKKMKNLSASQTELLVSEILRHKKLYYSGRPEISDSAFDQLEEDLRQIAPAHPVLNIVGAEILEDANRKVLHETPMLSLDKTYSVSDLHKWAEGHEVIGTLKVDGTSMSLVYEGGLFKLAKTRGNGREGEDVTNKLKWVLDAVKVLAEAESVEIRGELYCSESNFIKLSDEMERMGLERPTSPRNIVAGILGRKIHGDLARYFNFFAFDVIGLTRFKSEWKKLDWLSRLGFRMPEPKLLKSKTDLDEYLSRVQEIMQEDEVGCDGAVFTYNDLALHDELGHTAHHPRYKLSFKWQGETAQSKIKSIEWATSRLGIVTPVAVIEPVELSGATITNITLHNASHVASYKLKRGDVIELVRSGEVIPKFLSVVQSISGDANLPIECPSCGSKLISDDVRLKCFNTEKCPAQQSGAILNWIKSVGIDDLSDKRLQMMMDLHLVSNIPDLYKLTVESLLTLPSTKEKMAQKLFDNIQKSKSLPLAMFLNGLGIEGAGQTTWEKLQSEFHTLERIRALQIPEIISIDGFAERSAVQLVDGLKRYSTLIDELLAAGVDPQVQLQKSGDLWSGMTFVITGALSKPRKEVEEFIKSQGGRIGSSVSSSTSVLVTNETDSSSSKMTKAKSLGIQIWSELDLMSKV